MNIAKEKKTPVSSYLYGKIMSVSEAMELTNGFTKTVQGKSYVSFDAHTMQEMIRTSKCKLVSFRYYADHESTGLLLGPIYPIGYNKPQWLSSNESQMLDKAAVETLTQDDAYAWQGVKSHLYSAALLQEILALCTTEARVYFGDNNGMPALVIAPANAAQYNPQDMVCLDHGSLCPPDCYQLLE